MKDADYELMLHRMGMLTWATDPEIIHQKFA